MSNVSLSNVSRHFGAFVAVDRFNIDIQSGEFVTLLGPSGCGKTTTLRMLAGLERNTGGRITIGDTVVSDVDRGIFLPPEKRQLGMVFQSYAIWPHMTVFENVAYPLKIRRLDRDTIRKKVKATLEIVEMDHLADRMAPDLSGGQQQRVAIARSLVFEPQVLLLDEPLSNLDARLRLQMGDEFRALQQRLGITTVYVTHDQAEAMSLSDRVVLMKDGQILQNSPPRSIYLQPHSRDVASFFGTPNFFEIKARGSRRTEDGQFAVDVKGDGVSGHCLSATEPMEGETLTVMLRPESFRVLDAAEQSDGMVWDAEIRQATFRGPTQSLLLETKTGPIHVEADPTQCFSVGNRIRVGAPMSGAWAVPQSVAPR